MAAIFTAARILGTTWVGGNQIHVMATHFLNPEHHLAKLLVTYYAAFTKVGYPIVLAEDTPKIAVGKEDGA